MLVQMYEVQQGMGQGRDDNKELCNGAQQPSSRSHACTLPYSLGCGAASQAGKTASETGVLAQMYEVQQGMAQARDENEELRIRAQEAQAVAERAQAAAADAEAAAAEAFAAGGVPSPRPGGQSGSPSATRMDVSTRSQLPFCGRQVSLPVLCGCNSFAARLEPGVSVH